MSKNSIIFSILLFLTCNAWADEDERLFMDNGKVVTADDSEFEAYYNQPLPVPLDVPTSVIVKVKSSKNNEGSSALESSFSADRPLSMKLDSGEVVSMSMSSDIGSEIKVFDIDYFKTSEQSMLSLETAHDVEAYESKLEQVVENLNQHPEVEWATVNSYDQPAIDTNDFHASKLWGLQSGSSSINVEVAWEFTRGEKDVVVAVIDSGSLPNHKDLKASMIPDSSNPTGFYGYDMISTEPKRGKQFENFRAADGDGRDKDFTDAGNGVAKGQCNNGKGKAKRNNYHGAHVQGTIGAEVNNSYGIAGVAPGVSVVPVRALGKCGGSIKDIGEAILWAAGVTDGHNLPPNKHPADVINLSLGGLGNCNPFYDYAIKKALAAGSIVVAAAGNNNLPAHDVRPAKCFGVITVANTDFFGNKYKSSNYGPRINIAAPGEQIISAAAAIREGVLKLGFKYKNGTSMAAPHVSGTVALMLSINKDLTLQEVTSILYSTSHKFSDSSTCKDRCGAGILNTGKAVVRVLDLM